MTKIAVVTGASAGFGEAICKKLVASHLKVIGIARREEKLVTLQNELGKDYFYPISVDITNHLELEKALNELPEDWKSIDILINNAGLALGLDKAQEADFSNWTTMINTNVTALTFLTHLLLPKMVQKNSGFIINLGSTAGTIPYPGGNVYGATKAFVKQFSLNLRADLAGTKIRVTNIEPGLCEGTEFSYVRFNNDEKRVSQLYDGAHAITAEDIANTVDWLIQQPEHLNFNRIEMMPVSQSYGPQPVFRD